MQIHICDEEKSGNKATYCLEILIYKRSQM